MPLSVNQTYLEVAKKACEAERSYQWEDAALLWHLASEVACGRNRGWSLIRHEFCRIKSGVRKYSPHAFGGEM
ncbi:ANR family transcriptional regulator [Vibrio vulnificus]